MYWSYIKLTNLTTEEKKIDIRYLILVFIIDIQHINQVIRSSMK